jgi:hypothetical protein
MPCKIHSNSDDYEDDSPPVVEPQEVSCKGPLEDNGH